MEQNKARNALNDDFDDLMSRNLVSDGLAREGYLFNIKPHKLQDENRKDQACLLMYFAEETGEVFKCHLKYEPYFYVLCRDEVRGEVINAISKHFGGHITRIEEIEKVDLSLPNHLAGLTTKYIKLSFKNVQDLTATRNKIRSAIRPGKKTSYEDYLEAIEDTREHDVIYYTRVCIDLDIRCGLWYLISFRQSAPSLKLLPDKIVNPNLRILAFDLETYKSPLKFPEAEKDPIMMISYMIDGQGFLITNREIISDDIEDFEYTPKLEYEGKFIVFNEATEEAAIRKFYEHIKETKPIIFVTFNGDFFDWPYIQTRSQKNGINMEKEIGVYEDQGEYKGRCSIHMDCIYWVKRDAYLPQGSHGLKKVTKAKLGYDPVELDPEEMVPYARNRPNDLAAYSVSDAVATFYLYKKMIHDFIFALSTIIPLYPDDILRKGSGTLCEDLLMAKAYSRNIIFPNKTLEQKEKFYNGNLIESETYIGGHVECLQVGVYRSDIPVKFKHNLNTYQKLINEVDLTIDFCARVEQKIDPAEITNRDELRKKIITALEFIKDNSNSEAKPLIYHVDVAAMYPNIILSNRLQPTAIVSEVNCSACIFNTPENKCKRVLNWEWRGELFPLKKGEYEGIKSQLEQDIFNGVSFMKLPAEEQQNKIKERVKEYCRKAYNTVHLTKKELKSDTVCMRENSFYVDTVRDFRDRRYEYKNLVKVAGNHYKEALSKGDVLGCKEAEERMTLYESLQLAHKIILNSFYGYVMRKGARWYSMEMAGMVTHMGANIITKSRQLVEQIGKPLELDTDGIWCLLPSGFPENFTITTKSGQKLFMSYPCSMLNLLIYDEFKNDQYQDLENNQYHIRTEMSVFFEIDGPYRAMIIPASTQENKMLKKRYAVFNHAGKLTEIKGFELKRRGELKLIKVFQEEIFDTFLAGSSLVECYKTAGAVADRWWDILEYQGAGIDIEELIDFLCENRTLSKSVDEYGAQKSTSITAAKRLAEIVGDQIIKDKGLNCKILIAKKPEGATVTERALPSVIFQLSQELQRNFLRKWLKEPSLKDTSFQSVIDWDYYKERLGTCIQKIITIPATLQKVSNPNPRIPLPEWLNKRAKDSDSNLKQVSIKSMFQTVEYVAPTVMDIEDFRPRQEPVPQLIEVKNPPSFLNEFEKWIQVQKPAWLQRRKHNIAMAKLRKEGKVKEQPSTSISGYLKSKDRGLLYSSWHIIGVYQGNEPGYFKVWLLTEFKELHSINLEVKREIYISNRTARDNPAFKLVKMILPHNKTSNFLYEYSMSESEYEEKKFLLTNALADSNIEGIYESKIPSEILALMKIHSVVKPKIELLEHILETKGNVLGHLFSIDDFEIRHDSRYLSELSTLNQIFILSLHTGVRSIWTVIQPALSQVDVYIIMPGQGDKPSMQRIMREYLQDNSLIVNTSYPKREDQLLRLIEKSLKDQNKSSIVYLSSPKSLKEIKKHMNCLVNDFPVVLVKYSHFDLPALDWQRQGLMHMVEMYKESAEYIEQQIGLARYSGIPLGNLPQDSIVFISDVLFARTLKSSRYVLWWSEDGTPDMGADEKFNIDNEEFASIETHVPGFYTDIVAELDLGVLPTNAILCFKHLHMADLIENNPNDERSICLNAFRKVRSMISTWIEDVKKYKNEFADKLVMHSYRWLTSRNSKMYDPLLHLTVHKLIKQLFNHLLTEIGNFGVKVIYAHSDKIILSTKKNDLNEAIQACDFIIKSLIKSDTFTYLSLEYLRFWKLLLFKDIFNYAGIPTSTDEQSLKISSNFQMLDLLPEDLKNMCFVVIAQLLKEAYTVLQDGVSIDRATIISYLKEVISKDISQKLFEFVGSLKKSEELEFPSKVGSQFSTKYPPLEFIKIVVYILGLENDLIDEVQGLKKNLFKLIGFSDFSPNTLFIEPCASLVVPEIICKNCVYTRDIDFCRDPMISIGIWKCFLCDADFSRKEFENKLVFLLKNRIREFQMQDLKCVKCKMNRGGLLNKLCPCSGKFLPTKDKDEFAKFVGLVLDVASFHGFRYLEELIGPIMVNFY